MRRICFFPCWLRSTIPVSYTHLANTPIISSCAYKNATDSTPKKKLCSSVDKKIFPNIMFDVQLLHICLLYTSPAVQIPQSAFVVLDKIAQMGAAFLQDGMPLRLQPFLLLLDAAGISGVELAASPVSYTHLRYPAFPGPW